MKLVVLALDALEFAEKRFHELVDAPTQIAGHVKDLARATAGHVLELEQRLAQTEQLLDRVRSVLEEVSGANLPPALIAPAPAPVIAVDAAPEPVEPPAIVVVPIPLAPETAALQQATTEPSPG